MGWRGQERAQLHRRAERTFAERTFVDRQLGGSLFCSQDFEDRRDLQLIFPTLAFQLARKYPKFQSAFIPLVESNKRIADNSLYNQMGELIVGPLVESAISTVIVIDTLDKCKDEESASAILSVIGEFISELPRVKFFVTGCPEPQIQEGFRLPLSAGVAGVFVLHDVEPSLVNNDIQLFLEQSHWKLAGIHGLCYDFHCFSSFYCKSQTPTLFMFNHDMPFSSYLILSFFILSS